MKIDQYNDQYAIARIVKSHGYGHMEAFIHNLNDGLGLRPTIAVKCQIGGDGVSQNTTPYAWKWGVSHDMELLSPYELEFFGKIARKIEKKLEKFDDELGRPVSYSEFMARVLIASGVEHLFVNDAWGGGYSDLAKLPYYNIKREKGIMRDALANLERILVADFSKRAVA